LFVLAGRYAKRWMDDLLCSWMGYRIWFERKIDGFEVNESLLMADLDRHYRLLEKFKADFDVKFGKDLAEKIEAILKIGEKPVNLVAGKDGKLHKINREY
jgi:hypothetical protein